MLLSMVAAAGCVVCPVSATVALSPLKWVMLSYRRGGKVLEDKFAGWETVIDPGAGMGYCWRAFMMPWGL
jgi:hypothetical protein